MPTGTLKICTKCGLERGDFHPNKKAADGRQSWCIDCCRIWKRVARYGLEFDEVRRMERGTCQACGAEFTSTRDCHFDHDHRTEEFRGVLCRGCNIALGFLNDDIDRIMALAAYVLSWE